MAKSGMALILGPLGKKKPGEEEDMEDGPASAKQEALADFFDKGNAGDWAGAEDAFLTLMGICYPELEHSGSEYEEGEASEGV